MKNFLTIGVLAALAGSAFAQNPEAVQVTRGDFWNQTGGMMALGMSPNGRYIVGACASWEGFIYDRVTNKLVTTSPDKGSVGDETGANEFWCATDDGVAYGWDGNGGVALGIDGSYKVFQPTGNYFGVAPKGVTSDGSVVVGFYNTSLTMNTPCYWENGKMHDLEYSTSEEAGFKINAGCVATAISNDGKVIMGNIMSRSQTQPMVYWVRQDDGTYKYIPAFKDEYEDSRDVDGNLKEYYTTRLYKLFMPACMSGDGKTIVLYIQRVFDKEDGTSYVGPEEVALFDVDQGKVTTVIPYDRNNLLYAGETFTITGISNNGKMVGVSGYVESSTPVMLDSEDYSNALTLTEAYPGQDLLEEYYDIWEEWHGLYLLTGISADGNTLCGYIEGFANDSATTITGGMITFYIAPEWKEDGISTIGGDSNLESSDYFDLSGRKIQNPDKGIFIRTDKLSDGTVRTTKVVL